MKQILLIGAALLAACSAPAAVTKHAPLLLVGNKGEDTVSFIDLASGEELARVATSHGAPHEIATSPDNRQAAVVNYADQHIDVFDIASREIVRTIDLGQNARPHGIVWLPDGRIVVSAEGAQAVMEVLPDGTIETIKTDEVGTHMVVVSNDGGTAYAANLGAGTLSQIDLESNELVRTVTAGAGVEGIDLTPDGTELWVSNREANSVIVYDADTLEELDRLDVGQFPLRLAITPDGQYAVTSNLMEGSLSVIDVRLRELVRTIPVTDSPSTQQVTILFNEDGTRLYAAQTGIGTVAEVDFVTGKVVRMMKAGQQGDGLALIP